MDGAINMPRHPGPIFAAHDFASPPQITGGNSARFITVKPNPKIFGLIEINYKNI